MAALDLDLACQSAPLVTGPSPPTTSSLSSIGPFQVARSGESILFSPQDGRGNPLTITGVRSTDDVQILGVVGVLDIPPTLSLAGQTTAPIALHPTPPLTSFGWSATLPAPGSYDLALSLGQANGLCPRALYEVFDGSTRLGAVTIDQTASPPQSGGFVALGTFALSSTALSIQLSGPAAAGNLFAGRIRVVPTGSTDPALVGYIDPDNNRNAGTDGAIEGKASTRQSGSWSYAIFADTAGGQYRGYFTARATGTSPANLVTAADVQAALQALPAVPAGAVSVAATSDHTFAIHFTGALSGMAMATIVPSDAGLAITHDDTGGSSVGGQFPTATVNGTSYPLRAVSWSSGRPTVLFHLIQDAPDATYYSCGQGQFGTGSGDIHQGGLGGVVSFLYQPAQVATLNVQALVGPGDFELDLTWPVGDPAADVVRVSATDGLGNVLVPTMTVDQAQAPADFVEGGVGWRRLGRFHLAALSNGLTVSIVGAGTAGKHGIVDSIRLARTSDPRSVRILPTDAVTFSAPAGFLSTTTGPLPAVTGLAVAAAPGSRFPALAPGLRSMKLGYNCDSLNYYGIATIFANCVVRAGGSFGLANDAAGNPTILPGPSVATPLIQPAGDGMGRGIGAPNCESGTWVVDYSSVAGDDVHLSPSQATTTVTEGSDRLTITPGRIRRFFNVVDPVRASPSLFLVFGSNRPVGDGTYACDVKNVAVYPPGIDPNGLGMWDPAFLDKLRDVQCLRFMELFGTNNSNLADFAHFPDPTHFPLGYAGRTLRVPILSIGPPTPDLFCDNSVGGPTVRVVTAVPHGLSTGFVVNLRANGGGTASLGIVSSRAIDPTVTPQVSTFDPTDGQPNSQPKSGMVHVIDAVTFQMGIETYAGGHPPSRMTNTLTPSGGYVFANVAPGGTIAPADAAQLCADAGLEAWINVPILATDDCVRRLAAAVAARYPVGRRIHVEYGNEPWNYYFGFFHYLAQMDRLAGNDGNFARQYGVRMAQVHAIFRAAWVAAGRDANDVRRVCGVQQDDTSTTQSQIGLAVQNGTSFDELAPAAYFNNGPIQGSGDDLLTREQLLDLLALNVLHTGLAEQMASHKQIIASFAAAHPDQPWLAAIALVNYEGGPGNLTTPPMQSNIARANHGMHRDPDFAEIMLQALQALQDGGVTLFNQFTCYGVGIDQMWGTYEGYRMAAGTGDASLDVANRADFEDLGAIRSETGGALRRWTQMTRPPVAAVRTLRNLGATGRPAY